MQTLLVVHLDLHDKCIYMQTLTILSNYAAAPIQLAVNPLIIETELNTWANFTCTLSCEFKDDFRIRWFAGDTTLRGRLIRHGNPSKIIEEGDTCESLGTEGKFWQILRIRVDSIDLNKTPIQCTASPKTSQNTVHFSSYSVLKVKFNGELAYTTNKQIIL